MLSDPKINVVHDEISADHKASPAHIHFKSCAKGDGEVTELLRRPDMGCDGAAAEIGDGL